MPSPFPGVDPYIEQSKLWTDFHNGLANEIRAQLNTQIRPTYFARMTPYTTYEVVTINQSRLQGIRPDVGVMRRESMPWRGGAVAVLEAPPVVESAVEIDIELELLSVEIYHTDDEVLVTAIEVLSPVNKQPSHQAYMDYLRKRRELLSSTAHLLEIDLLRAGTRPPLKMDVPKTPYYCFPEKFCTTPPEAVVGQNFSGLHIMLSRAERRPFVKVWPIPLQAKLPIVPIPLRAPDPDTALDLGQVLANVYERGGYDVQIDYSRSVPPPVLAIEEVAWVNALLTSTF